jgi:hypothetical protein
VRPGGAWAPTAVAEIDRKCLDPVEGFQAAPADLLLLQSRVRREEIKSCLEYESEFSPREVGADPVARDYASLCEGHGTR